MEVEQNIYILKQLAEVETAFIIHSRNYDQIFHVIDQLIISEGYIAKKMEFK